MKISNKIVKKKWFSYTVATCSAVILFSVLYHLGDIFKAIGSFFAFIRPVISGIVIAYVFNPFANLFERNIFKKVKSEVTRWRLSVVCSLVALLLALALLGMALIPQLADSVGTLAENMDGYVATFQGLLKDFEHTRIGQLFGAEYEKFLSFSDDTLDEIVEYFKNNSETLINTSSNVGRGLFDGVLALILAVYFLLDKRGIIGRCSKLLSLLMKKETYDKSCTFLDRCNTITISYISVDIIDGVIVGICNFIFMAIMGMQYSVLISVIVAVTNLAPTFGPIVGAAIGGFILVLVNPWHALWFLIFTVILQTVDGYILKPKLFGDSLGVSALMILIAIILGGRLFGVLGILFAIPVAAIIDFTWKDFLLKRLEERHDKLYNQ